MANLQHFEILKQGVDSWNEWYSSNPEVIADLSGLCLSGFDLSGFVLTGANLTGTEFRCADLTGADLRGAVLTDGIFDGATLVRADLRMARGLSATALTGSIGNPTTQLPANMDRPSGWEQRPTLIFENRELALVLFSDRQPTPAEC